MDRDVFERMAEQENQHWWFRARRRIAQSFLDRLELPANARVLEAGAGTGGNIEMLSQYGQLHAFEIDEAAVHISQTKQPERNTVGHLPDAIPFGDTNFDLICAFDVLEHVQPDAESMHALADRLVPGGYFLMTVPACPFLWSVHDEKHHHHRRYRRPELLEKLTAAGLEIERLTYFNSILFPPIAMVRTLKQGAKASHSDDDGMPPAFLNQLLYGLMSSERFWLRFLSFPIGVSLLALARKPKD